MPDQRVGLDDLYSPFQLCYCYYLAGLANRWCRERILWDNGRDLTFPLPEDPGNLWQLEARKTYLPRWPIESRQLVSKCTSTQGTPERYVAEFGLEAAGETTLNPEEEATTLRCLLRVSQVNWRWNYSKYDGWGSSNPVSRSRRRFCSLKMPPVCIILNMECWLHTTDSFRSFCKMIHANEQLSEKKTAAMDKNLLPHHINAYSEKKNLLDSIDS